MKKQASKLVLARETVRTLNLESVAGGLSTLGPGETSTAGWSEISCGQAPGFCYPQPAR